MKSVLVTGASGYLGSKLVNLLSGKTEIQQIIGADVRAPSFQSNKVVSYSRDIRRDCDDLMRKHNVDAVIHSAWILPPIHDKARMEDINLNGTRAVVQSVLRAGVRHLLFTSSTTAYGFHPDNDRPLTEESRLRGNEDFTYSKCKRIIDLELQEFARANPEMIVTIVRPCFIVGPGFNNPMATYLKKKLVPLPSQRAPLQVVHEDDVTKAICRLLFLQKAGVYNIVPEGSLDFNRMVQLLGGYPISLPF